MTNRKGFTLIELLVVIAFADESPQSFQQRQFDFQIQLTGSRRDSSFSHSSIPPTRKLRASLEKHKSKC